MTQTRVGFLGGSSAGGHSGKRWSAGGQAARTYHLLDTDTGDYGVALCGARPGRASAGWFDAIPGKPATCARCNARAIAEATAAP